MDDVEHSPALTKELEDRRTEACQRSERMRLKTRTTVEVEDLFPFIQRAHRPHALGDCRRDGRGRAIEGPLCGDFRITNDKLAVVIRPTKLKSHLFCLSFL